MIDVDVAIVGGGISGLSTAFYLKRAKPSLRIAVIEKLDDNNSRIASSKLGSLEIELGADGFIARDSSAIELAQDLAIADQLVPQLANIPMIYYKSKLRPLPKNISLGVPTEPDELADERLITRAGAREMRRELKTDAPAVINSDISLGYLLREKFGDEVVDNVIDPLLGGIHAGRIDELSLNAVAPQIAQLSRTEPSLLRSLRKRLESTTGAPLFNSFNHGTSALMSGLLESLTHSNVNVARNTSVVSIEPVGTGYLLAAQSGEQIKAKSVVIATPSYVASQLISRLDATSAEVLSSIKHASVAMSVFVYPKHVLEDLEEFSGFLVPAESKLLMTACSFATNKWSRYDDGEHTVVRISCGRYGDERFVEMEDKKIVRKLHRELAKMLAFKDVPVAATTKRWMNAFPQYEVGHLDRLNKVSHSLAEHCPGIVLTGSSYRGIGIPACITQAKEAANEVVELVS